jgi:2'-5' RNA ligase
VASGRRRLGVALLLDPPLSDEVDGLRRALGDPSLGRVKPHVTLVPPVNVRATDLTAALARLRRAAAGVRSPLHLTFGPVSTFWPDNPVLYLDVGGDLPELRRLRDSAFAPPLERTLSWPWVPHVTLAETADEARIHAAVPALDRYAAVAAVDRVVLLEQRPGRQWAAIADAILGPRVIVGMGGLALEISRSRIVDPEAWNMVHVAGADPGNGGDGGGCHPRPPFFPIVLTARRESEVVGVAAAWSAENGAHVAAVVTPAVRRQGVGGHLLAHLESAIRREGWPLSVLYGHGPAGFYRARSGWTYSNATEA